MSQHPGVLSYEKLFEEAERYLRLCYDELEQPELLAKRLPAVEREIVLTGTYCHTPEELAYGCKIAWRNSNRCIGRLYWKMLRVNDMRHLTTAEAIFQACVAHLREGTNGGKICPTMSVFAPPPPGEPGIRILNPQLIRYAGYEQPDGSVIGDPAHVELTRLATGLGWRGAGTPFDVLPLIIQMPGEEPQMFELPQDAILEVPLQHPDFSWFADLGLKWHALPAVSNMALDLGGINYTAAPFNGWYMGTEIGARNLGDVGRYNMLPVIASKMGLNTSTERSLWIDRALVELNVAVIHSFGAKRVTIIDHHTASQHFLQHIKQEEKAGRKTMAEWSWIVPPISGSATGVFHRLYDNEIVSPTFVAQPECPAVPYTDQGCPRSDEV